MESILEDLPPDRNVDPKRYDPKDENCLIIIYFYNIYL